MGIFNINGNLYSIGGPRLTPVECMKIRSPRYPTPVFEATTTAKSNGGSFDRVVVRGDLVRDGDRYYIHPIGNGFTVENELTKGPLILHEVDPDTIKILE